jgi:hypothetical protein
MTSDTLEKLTEIGDQITSCDNIWAALRILTNELGMRAGKHLENLLLKDEWNKMQEALRDERHEYKQ